MLTKKNFFIKISLALILGMWCLFILSPLLLPDSLLAVVTNIIGKDFCRSICHQEEHKLIYLSGNYSLVCARCTGIYVGTFISSFISLFILVHDKKNMAIVSTALLMLFDVILTSVGVYPYSKFIAFMTGAFFGLVVFLYFSNAIDSLIAEVKTRKVI